MELDLSRSCKICSDQYGKACKLIIWFIILFAVVAAGCMIKGIVTVLRKARAKQCEIERENNTRLETINTELTQAKRAAEQAFEVANNASQSKSDFLVVCLMISVHR